MAKAKKAKASANLRDYKVLRGPIVTEKSSLLGSTDKVVVAFKVDPDATKTEIKQAVENIFEVEVDQVRTINYLGKVKRTTRSIGRRSATKKAYLTLKAGHSIDLVEGL